MQKRLAEIQARKIQIRSEVEATESQIQEMAEKVGDTADEKFTGELGAMEERVKALGDELDTLTGEEEELRKKAATRSKFAGSPLPKGDNGPGQSEAEQRGRELRQQRAVTVAGGTLVKPVGAQKGVNDQLGRGVSSIVDLVHMVDMVGLTAYQVPYEKAGADAAKTAENTDAHESDVEFDYAEIVPVTVTTYSEISRETTRLNDGAYYNKVLEASRKALRKKVSEFIVKGDAATGAKFIGILSAPAIAAASDVTLKAIDEKTLRTIAMNYGGDEDIMGEGVLVLNKNDLIAFGDVRGTNEKKAVYEITADSANTNTGVIKDGGLAVRYCINSNVTALADTAAGKYGMFYGVLSECYECGIFSDYEVRVSEDAAFRKRMIAVIGEVQIGGNVVVKNGFVRVKKGA